MNPYEPKRRVFHPERIAEMARKNREDRIRKYPDTARLGLSQEPQREVVVQIRGRKNG